MRQDLCLAAIRQRFNDDPSSDNVFDASEIAVLLHRIDELERGFARVRRVLSECEDYWKSAFRISDALVPPTP
jgi:hypothetical protein